jgi:streptogramin lyase
MTTGTRVFRRMMRTKLATLVLVIPLALGATSVQAALPGVITEYNGKTAGENPFGISAGRDGNLWFTEFASGGFNSQVAMITTSGVITEFPLPQATAEPNGITAGPASTDPNSMWFTENSRVGRIATCPTSTPCAHPITETLVPSAPSQLEGIAAGRDGFVWFTEFAFDAHKIGKINPATFAVTEFPALATGPYGITAGPIATDPNSMWFTEFACSVTPGCSGNSPNKIGRIGTSGPTNGVITEFNVNPLNSRIFGIASGPDGNLWFTENDANRIGRITPTGAITEFVLPPGGGGGPVDIAAGADGNMWFAAGNFIGRISPTTGIVTEFPIPTPNAGAFGITPGPDGNIWFTEEMANKIGTITTGAIPPPTPGCAVDITNGGWIIASNGDKSTFGGNAMVDSAGNVSGQEQYQDLGPASPMNVHSINVLSIVCASNFQSASIFGTATINGSGSFDYRIDVKDLDSLGLPDHYRMTLSTGYDSGDQPLGGGNITIH